MVVTFWLEVSKRKGRGLQQLVPAVSDPAWRKRCTLLNMVKKHPRTTHMGGKTGQLLSQPGVDTSLQIIFISCWFFGYHLTVFLWIVSHFVLCLFLYFCLLLILIFNFHFIAFSPPLSLSRSVLQERSLTTWLHMEEWRKKRPGLNLDRYPAFLPLQCSGFTPLHLRQAAVLRRQHWHCQLTTYEKRQNSAPSSSLISDSLSHTVLTQDALCLKIRNFQTSLTVFVWKGMLRKSSGLTYWSLIKACKENSVNLVLVCVSQVTK